MRDTYKMLTAFALGAAAGAVLGVLFAPDKGSNTRLKMNKKGREMVDEVNELMDKSKDKFTHLKSDLVKARKEPVEDMN
ncbi:MAG: YtxH domain-containing protein [Saprospiraceae bacterium]